MAGVLKYRVSDGRGKSPCVLSRPDGAQSRQIEAGKDGAFELHADDVQAFRLAGYNCIAWNEGRVEVKSFVDKDGDGKPDKPGKK